MSEGVKPMRKSVTYFERIPVRKVKEIVATPASPALESLLPGTSYDVHVSKLKIKDRGLIRTGVIER